MESHSFPIPFGNPENQRSDVLRVRQGPQTLAKKTW